MSLNTAETDWVMNMTTKVKKPTVKAIPLDFSLFASIYIYIYIFIVNAFFSPF